MKFSKQEMLSSPAVNGQATSPFLHQNRAKITPTLCHGHFRVSCKKTFSSEHPCSPTRKAQPPIPRATEPSPSLSLPHMQHSHLLPSVRLRFSTFFSILPPAACTFLCSPTSPWFQQLSRETSPCPLMAAPAAHRAAPVQLSHP